MFELYNSILLTKQMWHKTMTPKPQTRCDKYFIWRGITWENSAMKSTRAISGYLLFISQNEKTWKNYPWDEHDNSYQ